MQGDPRVQVLDEVHLHLVSVASEADKKLDESLLDRCKSILSPEIPHPLLVRLQGDAISTLRTLQQDPKPVTELTVAAASFITFADVQGFLNLANLLEGLQAPVPSISYLALIYLQKAAEAPGDAATIGSATGLIEALVQLWLNTSETYISEKALDVLSDLLTTDLPYRTTFVNKPEEDRVGNATGQGLLWRRVFQDKDVYRLLFVSDATQSGKELTKVQLSNAQGRLFDFVIKIAAQNWDAVATSRIPEVEESFNCRSLLDFVSNKMVDPDDFLMLVTKFDFFVKLVQLKDVPSEGCSGLSGIPPSSSPALEYLTSSGIHGEILQYYLNDEAVDSLTTGLLSNTHHRYIAAYLRSYPRHFTASADVIGKLVATLEQNLNIRPSVWAHGEPPYADLWILEALPLSILVQAGQRGRNPLLLVPSSPPNPGAFHALASIFRGPARSEVITFPARARSNDSGEGQSLESLEAGRASRQLLEQYTAKHPEFWGNVGAATDVLAMENAALAAITLIRAIATASWPSPPDHELSGLASGSQSGLSILITSGVQAFSALLNAPQPIAGAAGSDSSSVAWKIARAKFDALLDIQRLMQDGVGMEEVPSEHWNAIASSLRARIGLGPWGRSAGAGSRIQTLEE